MTTFEFFLILNDYPFVFLGCLLLSLLLFSYVINKSTSSWLNPLRFNIFTFSIGISVVLFLNFLGYVRNQTFVYIVISVIVFWSTFLLIFKNKQRRVIITFGDEPLLAKCLFYVCYFLFILMTLISYKLLGIPAFNQEGRLSTYTGSGFGFIARLTPMLYLYSVFYIIHLFISSTSTRKRTFPFLLLVPILIIGILSGSRSSFLVIVFAFWGYKTFFLNDEPKALDYKKLIIPTVLLSLISFSFSASGNFFYAAYIFFERVIASGDLYWEALPDETWSLVVVENPFRYVFIGFFGPLRIMDPNLAETAIGFQLTDIIYPAIAGRSTGPVALFPIFGLVCFGYVGGVVFSFFQALLASFLFKKTYIKSNSIILSALAYYGFSCIMYLIGDISAGLSMLLDLLISYFFILVLLVLIGYFLYTKDFLWKLKIIKNTKS